MIRKIHLNLALSFASTWQLIELHSNSYLLICLLLLSQINLPSRVVLPRLTAHTNKPRESRECAHLLPYTFYRLPSSTCLSSAVVADEQPHVERDLERVHSCRVWPKIDRTNRLILIFARKLRFVSGKSSSSFAFPLSNSIHFVLTTSIHRTFLSRASHDGLTVLLPHLRVHLSKHSKRFKSNLLLFSV
jgi:hypothetical protein